MKKENQRVKLTKRLLREALLHLLEKKTIDKISITELCGESGINRATFYRHYMTPADVLLDIEMEFVEKVNDSFDITLANDIAEYLEGLCTYLYDNSKLVKIFVSNNSEEDFTVLINNIFSSFVKRKSHSTQFQNIEQSNLKLISTYIAGGGYFMLRRWLLEDIEKTPKEIASLLMAFMNYTATFFDK